MIAWGALVVSLGATLSVWRVQQGGALPQGVTLGGGLAISALLFALLHTLASARNRATALAAEVLEEGRLRETQGRMLTTHSPVGVYELDAARQCVYVNPRLEAITGLSAEQLRGQGLADAVHPDDREVVQKGHARALSRCRPYARDCRLVRPSGEERWVHLHEAPLCSSEGVAISFVGAVEDITARKRLEEAMRASERRFRELIERSPDGIAVYRDRSLVYVSPAFVSYLGYPSAEALIGMRLSDLVETPDGDTVTQRIRASISPDGVPRRLEERLRRLDGGSLIAELLALEVEFEGSPATLVIVRDVTERKQLQAHLMRKDRLASVGTLAAGAAHEINNPLAAVITNLDYLVTELQTRDPLGDLKDVVGEALQGADRVRRIVRDLKLFSHSDEEQRGALDVRQTLEATLNVAASQIKHRAQVIKAYGEVPLVIANEARLGQVFLNLLSNAAHAIPLGDAPHRFIRISTSTNAVGQAVVELRDNGEGIPAHVLGRIFDPFFTTRPVGVGTGLGLSICHGIIGSFEGQIAVESELGKGTTVRILLPGAPASKSVVSEPAPDAARAARLRILVVDDDASLARAIGRTLRDHDITLALSGKEALEHVRSGAPFDAILCDLMMPDLTGMDVYHGIMTARPGLEERMIFMTGGAFDPRAREFLARVPNLRLEKPFDMQNLRVMLRESVPVRPNPSEHTRDRPGGGDFSGRPTKVWCGPSRL
jgi:PAS domain S-box-containing protein